MFVYVKNLILIKKTLNVHKKTCIEEDEKNKLKRENAKLKQELAEIKSNQNHQINQNN